MAEAVVFDPAVVRSWGLAAQASGGDVQSARGKVTAAAEDAACAHMAGLSTHHATQTYMSRVKHGVRRVADDVTGTGDKLVDTVAVVRSADDASADLFTRWGGPGS
ncbi:MAG: hypothetical protein GEU83_20435 [Pseudonocardiaceae bacterium]|nr:hypothetical protein [Pseudonocardiaceae bacterium]